MYSRRSHHTAVNCYTLTPRPSLPQAGEGEAGGLYAQPEFRQRA